MFEKIYHDIFHKSFKTDNIFHVYLESLNSNSEIVSKAVFTGCFQQMIIFVFVGLFYKIMSRIHKNIHNTGRMTTFFFFQTTQIRQGSAKKVRTSDELNFRILTFIKFSTVNSNYFEMLIQFSCFSANRKEFVCNLVC